MNDRASIILKGRRERIERLLGRTLGPQGDASPVRVSAPNRAFLLEEAQELYWNDLEWEHVTDEEAVEGGSLTALIFPGFLAFVRGLLLEEVMPDALAPANPRPEVVEDILVFLAGRLVEIEDAMSSAVPDETRKLRSELDGTSHLLDLVLHLRHGLSEDEVERLEAERHASA